MGEEKRRIYTLNIYSFGQTLNQIPESIGAMS